MKILYLFGIILIKYYTSKHFDTKIIISNRKGRYTNFRVVSPHVFSFSTTQYTVFLLLTYSTSYVTMILYLSFVLSLYRVSGYYLQYTCSLSWKIVSL